MNSPEQITPALKTIDDQFRNSPLPTKSESESAYQLESLAMLGNIKLFILSLSAAVTFAMLLVCANTSAMSVRERVREVAILRTMGYSRRMVLGLLLGEAAALGLTGCLLGMVLGVIASRMIASVPAGKILGNVHLGPVTVVVIVALALAVAMISSFVPAYQASKGEVVKGLRYVG